MSNPSKFDAELLILTLPIILALASGLSVHFKDYGLAVYLGLAAICLAIQNKR